jgi:P2-related tail formation protein
LSILGDKIETQLFMSNSEAPNYSFGSTVILGMEAIQIDTSQTLKFLVKPFQPCVSDVLTRIQTDTNYYYFFSFSFSFRDGNELEIINNKRRTIHRLKNIHLSSSDYVLTFDKLLLYS